MPSTLDLTPESLELLQHLALERVSSQWAAFLEIFSAEVASQLTEAEYRNLLVGMGARFAVSTPLAPSSGLVELEQAANAVWQRMRWGYVHLSDEGVHLAVLHHACPLPAALQLDAAVAGGFLEGVYGTWLSAAGAPNDLQLQQKPCGERPMCMAFELAAR